MLPTLLQHSPLLSQRRHIVRRVLRCLRRTLPSSKRLSAEPPLSQSPTPPPPLLNPHHPHPPLPATSIPAPCAPLLPSSRLTAMLTTCAAATAPLSTSAPSSSACAIHSSVAPIAPPFAKDPPDWRNTAAIAITSPFAPLVNLTRTHLPRRNNPIPQLAPRALRLPPLCIPPFRCMNPLLIRRPMTFPRARSHVPHAAPRTSRSRRILPIYAPPMPRWRILPRINGTSRNACSFAPTATSSVVVRAAWLTIPTAAHNAQLSLPVPPLLLAPSPPATSPLLRIGIFYPSSPAESTPPTALGRPPWGRFSTASSPPPAISRIFLPLVLRPRAPSSYRA